MKTLCRGFFLGVGFFICAWIWPRNAEAHSEYLDGEMIRAAENALETGRVELVLSWVEKKDEEAVKTAFAETRDFRKMNPLTREMEDVVFFEKLVRIHRAAEGKPDSGLKRSVRKMEPWTAALERALEIGSEKPLLKITGKELSPEFQKKFREVLVKKKYSPEDVEAGRAYVKAYQELVREVEGWDLPVKGLS